MDYTVGGRRRSPGGGRRLLHARHGNTAVPFFRSLLILRSEDLQNYHAFGDVHMRHPSPSDVESASRALLSPHPCSSPVKKRSSLRGRQAGGWGRSAKEAGGPRPPASLILHPLSAVAGHAGGSFEAERG